MILNSIKLYNSGTDANKLYKHFNMKQNKLHAEVKTETEVIINRSNIFNARNNNM